MPIKRCPKLKGFVTLSLVGLLILLSVIPVRLAIALHQAPEPQAILTLGGATEREVFTAQFAQRYPSLDVWISTGSPASNIRGYFQTAGVADDRLHLDYRAVDTVTNFTTLVSDFQQRGIQHIFLITSDFHMPRASVIATVVLGSRGIAFTPVRVYSGNPRESTLRILRDSGRALLWLVTGRTGASLRNFYSLFHLFEPARITVS